jgi:hypothetical protein
MLNNKYITNSYMFWFLCLLIGVSTISTFFDKPNWIYVILICLKDGYIIWIGLNEYEWREYIYKGMNQITPLNKRFNEYKFYKIHR